MNLQEMQEQEYEQRIEAQAEYDEKIEIIMKCDGVTQEVAEYMIENDCSWQLAEEVLNELK